MNILAIKLFFAGCCTFSGVVLICRGEKKHFHPIFRTSSVTFVQVYKKTSTPLNNWLQRLLTSSRGQ